MCYQSCEVKYFLGKSGLQRNLAIRPQRQRRKNRHSGKALGFIACHEGGNSINYSIRANIRESLSGRPNFPHRLLLSESCGRSLSVSANIIQSPSNKKRNPSKESRRGCALGYSFLFGSCLFLLFNLLYDHNHGSLWNSAHNKPTSIAFQLARYQLTGRIHILSCKAI